MGSTICRRPSLKTIRQRTFTKFGFPFGNDKMTTLNLDGQQIDIERQLMELDRADCEDSLYTFLKHSWKYIDASPLSLIHI
jgi:hypothetical protein